MNNEEHGVIKLENETHRGFKMDETNSVGQECWGCGNWLIGGSCWKNGQMSGPGWRDTGPSDSCEEWVKESTPGTITGDIKEQIELEKKNAG